MVENGERAGGHEEGETRGCSCEVGGRFDVKMGEDSFVGLGGKEGARRGTGEREEERGGI